MKESELLKPEFIISDLKGESKEEIINELVDLLKMIHELKILKKYDPLFLNVKKLCQQV